jgi:hypothetical protein
MNPIYIYIYLENNPLQTAGTTFLKTIEVGKIDALCDTLRGMWVNRGI